MKRITRANLEKITARKGADYLNAVMEVATIEGDVVMISEEDFARLHPVTAHPSLPQMAGSPFVPQPTAFAGSGPGTELKKLLKRIGITASPNCSCNRRAAEMDARGIEWCEQNVQVIVGWLREEAGKRGLPFVDMAGAAIVKLAIRKAKRIR